MKKLIINAALIAITCTALIGCGSKPSSDATTSAYTAEAKSIKTSEVKVEEALPVTSQQIDDQIQQLLEQSDYGFDEPYIIVDPYQNSPLTAVALFKTEEEVGVRFTVVGDKKRDNVSGTVSASKEHRVPIVGLYPNRENKVKLELLDTNQQVVDTRTVTIQTDPLPTTMKDLVKTEQYKKKSVYGLIEVSGQSTPHCFAYDSSGTVRWYLSMDNGGYGMFPISGGHFMLQADGILIPTDEKPHTTEFYEMDYLGRVYNVYYAKNGVHHEIIEKTEGGNLLILTSSIDGHVEDVVQELDRETGKIVKSLDMREIFGDTHVDMIDWAHLNTCSYNAETDTVILSPRNVHSGIKVNWTTNELEWILSDPSFWEGTPFEDKVLKPVGDVVWAYQPHSIYEVPYDIDNNKNTMHIALFDNHWDKTRKIDTFDGLKGSYVTIYNINEKKKTVSMEHTYEGVKSKITSNYRLNYEKKRVFSMGGVLDPLYNGQKSMIYEFDYDTEKVLNQYSLKNTFYRAYEFEPDYDVLATPMNIGENYLRGELRSFKADKKTASLPKTAITKGVTFSIVGDVLYTKASDHAVSKVELISDDASYSVQLKKTAQEAKYKKLNYKVAFSMSKVKSGTYQVVVTYKDKRYCTGKTVTL
ncbi:MAG: aryl-sulfate sulfotransferase [Lachnospiraceae bacterium]